MLRNKTRSIQKDQHMVNTPSNGGSANDSSRQSQNNSFFNGPGLFVGLSPQVVSDCDSVRSPTSPLDLKLFSSLGNSFRFPKPSQNGHQKSWDSNKVGLGNIVDSLDESDDNVNLHKKPMLSSDSKTILFGSQVRSKSLFSGEPKSLPKNYAVSPLAVVRPSDPPKGSSDVFFEVKDDPLERDLFGKVPSFSLDSKRQGLELLKLRRGANNASSRTKQPCFEGEAVQVQRGSAYNLVKDNSVSSPMSIASWTSEMELSEDYTCITSHGPNPKTTHIFGDCVLECHPIPVGIDPSSPYPSDHFLSQCCFCIKKLAEGTNIYMYRGEKAFCSSDCREEWISIEEEKEKAISKASEEPSECGNGDEIFEKTIFFAI